MIYLIDPELPNRPPCIALCTRCGVKPLYGIDPVPI